MKNILTCIIALATFPGTQSGWTTTQPIPVAPAKNLFIITIDGFRWQELFTGADKALINNTKYTSDTSIMKMMYWAENPEERRKRLMPFFWNIIGAKGQVYGNRNHSSKVNVANLYKCSYPGYNEIFTGRTDLFISSNRKIINKNTNVLEYLNGKDDFNGKVVAFTSWDVFPFILNKERCDMVINSGYEMMEDRFSDHQSLINAIQSESVIEKGATRYDQLTFINAKEYLQHHKSRVVFIGLGETDEFAHQGRYDLYLEQANKIDKMIGELWHWVQTTPGYKDNTTILITTDHGRGSKESKWTSHGTFIKGSSQTWLALIGPGVEPLGEIRKDTQLYQQQLAGLIAGLVGEKF